jgi:hypothetical protein
LLGLLDVAQHIFQALSRVDELVFGVNLGRKLVSLSLDLFVSHVLILLTYKIVRSSRIPSQSRENNQEFFGVSGASLVRQHRGAEMNRKRLPTRGARAGSK